MTTDVLTAACERVLALVPGGVEAQVTASRGRSALTRFANSYIHQNVAEDGVAVRLKVALDGQVASAATNQEDDGALERLVDATVKAARLRPADPDWPGMAPPEAVADVEHFDDATAGASPDDRAGVVRAFVDAGEGLSAAGYCDTSGSTVAFANTTGQRAGGRSSRATISGIHQTARSEGLGGQAGIRLTDLDARAEGARAADKARASADTVDIEPGVYEVVLEPDCVANMLQFIASSGFNGKAVAEGRSFVHVGEQQFDERLDIFDDAGDSRTTGLLFDVEGTPKRRVDFVQAGVSTGVAHDRRTGARAGVGSTGHASGMGESFGAVPANLFLGDGPTSLDDLIAGVERGLLVTSFHYTRILDPKTQVVTGLTRSGLFLVEDGKIGGAVSNLRFTQSYVSALAPGKVKGVGSDGRLVGNYHVPSLHLAGWNFTGGAKG
jgi:predicted Zn-dependent protease